MQLGERGFFLAGMERHEGEVIEIRSPFDQSVIGTVRQADRTHALDAVTRLHGASAAVRALPAWRRKEILEHVAHAIREKREQLTAIIVAEAGKPVKAARGEVDRAIFTFTIAAEEAVRQGGEVLPLDLMPGNEGRWGMVRRFPSGPVLAITPFNFPLNLVAHKLAPAIAAGCPVLLKPAPQTPFSSLALAELIYAAGWPADALSVLPLSVEDTGFLVQDEDRLKVLSFTGSARVGWELKQKAGKKRVLLELGGNAAAIVHSDWGDIAGAAQACVTGAMSYAGQSCISVQRVYVERAIFHRFVEAAVKHAEALVVGDPAEEKTDIGPVIRPSDADRIQSWLREAEDAGATVLTGGTCAGSLIPPTLLTGTRSPMKVLDEEVFAPVMAIERYDDFDAALAEVNRSRYGLQAGLFTRDAGRIFEAYQTLEVGGLIVGVAPTWRLDPMPYGGVRDSGLGREGLRYAIEEMTELRLLVMALDKMPEKN
ncbi:aldehyde dehydrogenase family protein [Paracidobacterium acidisoli]|uniref:Aldehyde dehydrogenase family protein n=1 Tax=Paracidobacterium acidisoli TaxID=2303751 RepID=A0A372IP20_9BACT|nr:aldehyde dehydrogenase family protein [Paracidobacterium acidisoli]MBT9332167.1 aldehyde dehydrogenase family protein [Paracidobacterium acidisoli]